MHEVDAQRRHPRQAVVREHVERAGEDVVEASDDHVRALESGLDRVDRADRADLIRGVGRGSGNDIAIVHAEDRLGRVTGSLTVERPFDRDVDALNLHHSEREVVGGRLTLGDPYVVEALVAVLQNLADDQVVRPGRKLDAVLSLVVGHYGLRLTAAKDLDLHQRDRITGHFVVHRSDQRPLLSRDRAGEDGERRDRAKNEEYASYAHGEPRGYEEAELRRKHTGQLTLRSRRRANLRPRCEAGGKNEPGCQRILL